MSAAKRRARAVQASHELHLYFLWLFSRNLDFIWYLKTSFLVLFDFYIKILILRIENTNHKVTWRDF